MKTKQIKIKNVTIGGNNPLVLIAGSCAIESEKSALHNAKRLKEICEKIDIPLIYKSSYDKANRTAWYSYRGLKITKGLKILQKIKNKFNLPILSDVHCVREVKRASQVLDCIQIPAFLSRQTDLITKVAKTKKPINIKKGQFLSIKKTESAIQKIKINGNYNILITERGVCFGHDDLIVDYRGIQDMIKFGYPIIFDATHSGKREYAKTLALGAIINGCHGLFIEVHENPKKALCDSVNMLSLDELEEFLILVKKLDNFVLQNGLRR